MDGICPRCFGKDITSQGWMAEIELAETKSNKNGGPASESQGARTGNLAPNSQLGTVVSGTESPPPFLWKPRLPPLPDWPSIVFS